MSMIIDPSVRYRSATTHATHHQTFPMQPLGQRLKSIRRELKLSQEAVGAQGFVSTPGWIKIENGQRQASDKLIEKFIAWLIREGYAQAQDASRLQDEFLSLKYARHASPFVREMARRHFRSAHQSGDANALIVAPKRALLEKVAA